VIRSMTGFAAASRESDAGRVQIAIKSVNHRFLDVALKVPSLLAAVESRLRAQLQQRLTRGRVEVSFQAEAAQAVEREVVIDERLLEQVSAALEPLRARGVVAGVLSASDLLRVPQLFEIRTRTPEAASALPPAVLAMVDEAMTEALDSLVTMRETEGGLLGDDLDARLATLERFVEALQVEAASAQAALEGRLRERVAAMPADLQGDTAAVAQEIVRFVARSDIDEEIVRLRAHVVHWRGLAAGPEACGRKLDFLVQEMNREINTIGSKMEGTAGTAIVIDAKSELERIREQAQNVE
jgi:uncharacterized protein (TIGR00255 family)